MAKKFDRSRFKAAKMEEVKAQKAEEDIQMGYTGKAGFVALTNGKNRLKIFPPHPDGGKNYRTPRVVHWGDFPREDDKGNVEFKRGTMLNSKVHGRLSNDLHELYIDWLKKIGDDEAYDAATFWKDGIARSYSWAMYVKKILKAGEPEYGLCEVGRAVRNGMDECSIIDDDDDGFEFDPFSDPDEGKPVLITWDPQAKAAKDKYKVQMLPKAHPLTDEELEKLLEWKALEELYQWKPEFFETTLKALEHYDEENGIGLFENDGFLAEVELLREEMETKYEGEEESATPQAEDDDDDIEEDSTEEESDEEEDDDMEEESEEGDEYDEMNRTELKRFIVKNGLKDTVKVYKSTKDDELRDKIRAAMGADLPFDPDEEEEETEPEPKKADAAAVRERLKKMRK